jgi:hypothetical protein
MVEAQVDPMEPPKFKHKRVPRSGGSPPPPVLHSPPRNVVSIQVRYCGNYELLRETFGKRPSSLENSPVYF